MVARGAAELEFVGDGVAGVVVAGVVVVFEEVGGAAVDAAAVAFLDDALLADRGVPAAGRRVDRAAVGVVDQRSEEGRRCESFDNGVGDGSAVVEGAAVASYVEMISVSIDVPPSVTRSISASARCWARDGWLDATAVAWSRRA